MIYSNCTQTGFWIVHLKCHFVSRTIYCDLVGSLVALLTRHKSTVAKFGRALSIKAEVILAALTGVVKSKMTAVEKILLLLLAAGKWDVNFVLIFVTVKQCDKQPYVILGVLWVKQQTKEILQLLKQEIKPWYSNIKQI